MAPDEKSPLSGSTEPEQPFCDGTPDCVAMANGHLRTCARYQAPPSAKASTASISPPSRVITQPDGNRIFVAPAKDENQYSEAVDQEAAEAEAEALRLARDPAAWIDANITTSELGKPFALAPYQRAVLKKMFVFDKDGKLWADDLV
jgi:hypothetical protein